MRRAQRRSTSSAAALSAPGFTASLAVPSIAGILVTPQTALTFMAWYAGCRVITEDLASLPLFVFQHQAGGGSQLQRKHPVSERFNWSPDGECTDLQWREAFYGHVLGWGNAYAEIEWDGAGDPVALHMIHPSIILPKRTREGKLFYELQNSLGNTGRRRQIPPWDVLHLAGLGFNGLVGYSPVALGREGIGLGKALEQFGSSFMGNGAVPAGVLEYPGVLRDEARKNLREEWNLVHQGSASANKIAVLQQGVKFVLTQISPEQAQFLASREFQVVEICRILRLPPHKLADFTTAHLANLEAANDDYIISCLRPWAIRVEKSIDFKLLGRDGYNAGFYVKHDFRSLLLKLTKDRADYYRKMWEIGIYTVNEIRELEGLNPIKDADGGNLRFKPVNIMGLTEKLPDPAAKSPQNGQKPDEKAPDETEETNPRGLMEILGERKNGHFAA